MATSKKKSANKSKGFRVSYSMLSHTGKWKRDITAIVYKTRQEAQQYANQLNKGNSTRNARVRKV